VHQTTANRGHEAPVPGNDRLTKPDLIGQICDIIKLDLKETGCEDVGCTRLSQFRPNIAFVNMVMDFWFRRSRGIA
jgi:hypothetical protein